MSSDPLTSCLGAILWCLLLSECWQLIDWLTISNWLQVKVTLRLTVSYWLLFEVKVTLRLTVSQSVSLGIEPHLGLMTRYLLLFDSYGLVFVGRPLDGSVICICCWPLPAQYFSGPSPLVLATIYYCPRFETSLFVASYDSQGHGGGIRPRPRLHTLTESESESYVTTDGQSASLSWNKAPIRGLRPDFYYRRTAAGLLMWGALSDERTGLSFTIAAGPSQRSHSPVRAPWNSRSYFTVSYLRLPISSPPTTRRVTVEVFDPASTRVPLL
jgi:hypothetical protein